MGMASGPWTPNLCFIPPWFRADKPMDHASEVSSIQCFILSHNSHNPCHCSWAAIHSLQGPGPLACMPAFFIRCGAPCLDLIHRRGPNSLLHSSLCLGPQIYGPHQWGFQQSMFCSLPQLHSLILTVSLSLATVTPAFLSLFYCPPSSGPCWP